MCLSCDSGDTNNNKQPRTDEEHQGESKDGRRSTHAARVGFAVADDLAQAHAQVVRGAGVRREHDLRIGAHVQTQDLADIALLLRRGDRRNGQVLLLLLLLGCRGGRHGGGLLLLLLRGCRDRRQGCGLLLLRRRDKRGSLLLLLRHRRQSGLLLLRRRDWRQRRGLLLRRRQGRGLLLLLGRGDRRHGLLALSRQLNVERRSRRGALGCRLALDESGPGRATEAGTEPAAVADALSFAARALHLADQASATCKRTACSGCSAVRTCVGKRPLNASMHDLPCCR